MSDVFKTDKRLAFDRSGEADISLELGDFEIINDRDNLVQALYLRLLTKKGELAPLGHPGYGSRIHELIGESINDTNLELLRRYVRQALSQDPRVKEVTMVNVFPGKNAPGIIEIEAEVLPLSGESVLLGVTVDVG